MNQQYIYLKWALDKKTVSSAVIEILWMLKGKICLFMHLRSFVHHLGGHGKAGRLSNKIDRCCNLFLLTFFYSHPSSALLQFLCLIGSLVILIFNFILISIEVCVCMCSVAQSRLTLCHPIKCGLTASSVHGISQARILEWVVISSSRGSSWPTDWTFISCVPLLIRWILYYSATWEAQMWFCTVN